MKFILMLLLPFCLNAHGYKWEVQTWGMDGYNPYAYDDNGAKMTSNGNDGRLRGVEADLCKFINDTIKDDFTDCCKTFKVYTHPQVHNRWLFIVKNDTGKARGVMHDQLFQDYWVRQTKDGFEQLDFEQVGEAWSGIWEDFDNEPNRTKDRLYDYSEFIGLSKNKIKSIEYLKNEVYEEVKNNSYEGNIDDQSKYKVLFSGNWAVVKTPSTDSWDYYFKLNNDGFWILMNNPYNHLYKPEDAPNNFSADFFNSTLTKTAKPKVKEPWRYAEVEYKTNRLENDPIGNEENFKNGIVEKCWEGASTLSCEDARDIMRTVRQGWIDENNISNAPRNLKIWTHPQIHNKAVVSFIRDANNDYYNWAIKKNGKWYIPDDLLWPDHLLDSNSSYERERSALCKKWGVNPKWDFKDMSMIQPASYDDILPESETKSVEVKAWIWNRAYLSKDGISEDCFETLNQIPINAKDIFYTGFFVYWREEVIKKPVGDK